MSRQIGLVFRRSWRHLMLGGTIWCAIAACSRPPKEVAQVALPDGHAIAVVREPAHSFLAEYTRVVQLLRDGAVVSADSLIMDTGGYGRLELFAVGGDRYVLRGPMQLHMINAATESIASIDSTSAPPGELIGVFDIDSNGAWSYIATRDSIASRVRNRDFTG